MCLILLAYDSHPDYPIVFAGNRDEFYDRPATPASFWDEAPHVLAGRDRKSGGTWLGVTRRGHWATVTNVRDETSHREDAPSRGHFVADYLKNEPSPSDYLEDVAARADEYNGFNLLVGTPQTLYYFSNRNGPPRSVAPGIHGMSNAQLDDPWPKVQRGTARLRSLLDGEISSDQLLDILSDRRPAPDEKLPDTGLGRTTERKLSPPFIEGDQYGTRSSTVLLIHRSGTVTFVERTFDRGTPADIQRFSFEPAAEPAA
ncbi:MAG: NRDE family protein [Salinibacter sp.]|uniref:NRDE family protein n=1 Tax=Salinibacter sp. TaxID=2065818 RepID=UPI0035D49B09